MIRHTKHSKGLCGLVRDEGLNDLASIVLQETFFCARLDLMLIHEVFRHLLFDSLLGGLSIYQSATRACYFYLAAKEECFAIRLELLTDLLVNGVIDHEKYDLILALIEPADGR